MSNSLRPHGLYGPWYSPGQNTGVGSCSFLQGIFPTQGSNLGLPHLQVDSLPAEPPGKPKNTAVGSLSLLQGILPTQELNQGLLHCRRILYQLSSQGSPEYRRLSSVSKWCKGPTTFWVAWIPSSCDGRVPFPTSVPWFLSIFQKIST